MNNDREIGLAGARFFAEQEKRRDFQRAPILDFQGIDMGQPLRQRSVSWLDRHVSLMETIIVVGSTVLILMMLFGWPNS